MRNLQMGRVQTSIFGMVILVVDNMDQREDHGYWLGLLVPILEIFVSSSSKLGPAGKIAQHLKNEIAQEEGGTSANWNRPQVVVLYLIVFQ